MNCVVPITEAGPDDVPNPAGGGDAKARDRALLKAAIAGQLTFRDFRHTVYTQMKNAAVQRLDRDIALADVRGISGTRTAASMTCRPSHRCAPTKDCGREPERRPSPSSALRRSSDTEVSIRQLWATTSSPKEEATNRTRTGESRSCACYARLVGDELTTRPGGSR